MIPNINNGASGLVARTAINQAIDLLNIISQNVYKITYYEIISGASGSLTKPSNSTINTGEFGPSGNCILSEIDGSNKPTYSSPKTASGVIVTASLDEITGAWVKSGITTSTNVALIYSINITEENYQNCNNFYIIDAVNIYNDKVSYVGADQDLNLGPKNLSANTIEGNSIYVNGRKVNSYLRGIFLDLYFSGDEILLEHVPLMIDAVLLNGQDLIENEDYEIHSNKIVFFKGLSNQKIKVVYKY